MRLQAPFLKILLLRSALSGWQNGIDDVTF